MDCHFALLSVYLKGLHAMRSIPPSAIVAASVALLAALLFAGPSRAGAADAPES